MHGREKYTLFGSAGGLEELSECTSIMSFLLLLLLLAGAGQGLWLSTETLAGSVVSPERSINAR